MDILRFITAGSVDDGKSTLIGRLLYDSKSILEDQMEALEKHSRDNKQGAVDLALLTDGLRAEREQGITIDVAYKYFSTPARKFIIADAPGHIQYTRNMVTGASNSDCIVILIDARAGVVEQTRRHSIIASLLQIPHVIVAVNKMDLVDHSENTYNDIVLDYTNVAASLGLPDVTYIPISALTGDNIVTPSDHFSWYTGEPLLRILESIEVQQDMHALPARFAVQYVIRPQTGDLHDYRGYAGKVNSGVFRKGDVIKVLPSGLSSTIDKIEIGGQEVDEAFAPQSIILHLADDIDVGRGDVVACSRALPRLEDELELLLCWMDSRPLVAGSRYLLQHNSRTVKAVVRSIDYTVDVTTLDQILSPRSVNMNDIARISIKTAEPLAYDSYTELRTNGSAIFIDQATYVTVGACMLQ